MAGRGVLAVYERMDARELVYPERVVKRYPSLRVNQIPDQNELYSLGPTQQFDWSKNRSLANPTAFHSASNAGRIAA